MFRVFVGCVHILLSAKTVAWSLFAHNKRIFQRFFGTCRVQTSLLFRGVKICSVALNLYGSVFVSFSCFLLLHGMPHGKSSTSRGQRLLGYYLYARKCLFSLCFLVVHDGLPCGQSYFSRGPQLLGCYICAHCVRTRLVRLGLLLLRGLPHDKFASSWDAFTSSCTDYRLSEPPQGLPRWCTTLLLSAKQTCSRVSSLSDAAIFARLRIPGGAPTALLYHYFKEAPPVWALYFVRSVSKTDTSIGHLFLLSIVQDRL